MEIYAGTALLCIIPGILAAFVHKKLEGTSKLSIGNVYFYCIINYGAMSFVRTVLGFGGRTLFACFNSATYKTYVHYTVPLVMLSLIMPFIIKRILDADKRKLFMKSFASTASFIMGLEFLSIGVVTNYHYIAVCFLSAVLSLLATAAGKWNIAFYSRGKIKERMLFILPIILLWTITVLIFEPNQMLLNNLDEFSIPYFPFLMIMLLWGAVLTAAYVIIGVFALSDRQLKAFGAIILGFSAAGYIQGNFLNGEMLVMDGNIQTWGMAQQLVNIIVWSVLLAAAVFAVYNRRYQKISSRIVQILCVYICLMQLLSLAFLIITAKFPKEENEFTLTTNHMFELDKENNVVVFVLDWFDRQIMNDIVKENPNFTKKLKDFTDYTNTTSRYAYTALSMPYLLTGVEWEYGMDAKTYCEYAYDNSSFIEDIEEAGYSIGMYTGAAYVGDSVKNKFVNYSNEIVKTLGYKKAFYVMNNASKYKMAPFAAKQFYFYTTDDIAGIVVNTGEYSVVNDIIFHNELQRNKLSLSDSENYRGGVFKLYHLKGAHPLYNMNEDFEEIKENGTQLSQSKGSLKIVYEYIDEMKRLGIYDKAAIIITADHGQNTDVMRKSKYNAGYDMTSTPILFVKLPGETHEEGPKASKSPVSHTEFAASVINAVGGDYAKYGRTFAQISADESRERIFTYANPPDKKYKRYVINGDSNNPESWGELED